MLLPEDRLKAWTTLLSYCEAKPKENVEENPDEVFDPSEQLKDVTNSVLIKILKAQKTNEESTDE